MKQPIPYAIVEHTLEHDPSRKGFWMMRTDDERTHPDFGYKLIAWVEGKLSKYQNVPGRFKNSYKARLAHTTDGLFWVYPDWSAIRAAKDFEKII
jgi:hypothetical protein